MASAESESNSAIIDITNVSSASTKEIGNQKKAEKAVYKTKQKVFCYDWLNDPKFKEWLQPVKDNKHLCKCAACDKTLTCGRSEIEKHSKGIVHQKRVKLVKSSAKIDCLFDKATSEKKERQKFETTVKKAEILISGYIAEHNIAFSNVEHLVAVLKNADPDSKVFRHMQLKRQKCTAIIKNIIAKVETEELITILQTVSMQDKIQANILQTLDTNHK